MLKIGALALDRNSLNAYSITDPSASIDLHSKDLRLLEYLMRHINIIVTREQIAEALLLEQDANPHNLITVRVKILRQKLADIGFPEAIESVYGQGYRLVFEAFGHRP